MIFTVISLHSLLAQVASLGDVVVKRGVELRDATSAAADAELTRAQLTAEKQAHASVKRQYADAVALIAAMQSQHEADAPSSP